MSIKSKKIRESYIENYLNNQIKHIGGLSYKFTSIVNGVPDRIIIFNKCIYLVELKRPNETPRPNQEHIHNKIREQGVPVHTIDSTHGVDMFIRDTLKVSHIDNNSTQKNRDINDITFHSKNIFDI